MLTGENGSDRKVSTHAGKCLLDLKHQKDIEHRRFAITTSYFNKKSQCQGKNSQENNHKAINKTKETLTKRYK
jgi:hypothetical protein